MTDAAHAAGTAGARVEALLADQETLFGELDALSRRQSALVAGEDADGVLEVLAARQVIIDRIGRITAALEPYRARWQAFFQSLEPRQQRAVQQRIDSLSQLAGRIATRDEADRAALEQRQRTIAAELAQVKRGRGALAAYGNTNTGNGPSQDDGPRFQDTEV